MVETMPPLLASGMRFLAAGAIFWVALRLSRGSRRVRVTWREVGGAGAIGTLLVFGGNGLVSVAEQEVPSGLAALIVGSVPLWVVLLRTVTGDRVALTTLGGVAVGFAGLALLVLPGDRPGDAPLLGVLTVLVAAASWASGSFFSRRTTQPDDALVATAWQMILGGLVSFAVGTAFGELGEVDPSAFSADSLIAFAYLIFIGSLVAFTAYVWLLKNVPISMVATYAYVNPVIAIFLGWAILSEEVTLTVIAGAAAIVASVAVVVRQESAAPAAEREPVTSGT
jgi:drug/metabolite transporter (DMT)-like permease